MTKPKRFLDSLRDMVSPAAPDKTCSACHTTYSEEACPSCGKTAGNGGSPADKTGSKCAYLVDLVSNHKIQVPVPICKVGRDECNDIVISGDQAISRQHFCIVKEGDQFFVDDNKSRHGTFINGTQIKIKEPINDGDVIKIGVSLFWFVAEASELSPEALAAEPSGQGAVIRSGVASEPQHVQVKSEFFMEPTDPSTSTANDIPVMANEEALMDRLRLKTRSFENSDAFVQAQIQPGGIRPPANGESPAHTTQSFLPALDGILGGGKAVPANNMLTAVEEPDIAEGAVATKIPEMPINQAMPASPVAAAPVISTPPAPKPITSPNGQTLNEFLGRLESEHNKLKTQIEQAEKQRQEIATQISAIKDLISHLIGGTQHVLMNSCQKVLTKLGWQSTATGEDGQDLHLSADNQTLIVHLMWTDAKPERAHLGKLFIAQTRFWCEHGLEPKGVLVISLLGSNKYNLDQESKVELANFVRNKNVCLLTSANLLAIYHSVALNQIDGKTIRDRIMHTDGWLEGFDLLPLE